MKRKKYMKRKKPPYIYNPSTNEFLINIKKESDDYDKSEKHHIYFFTIIAILVIILLLI